MYRTRVFDSKRKKNAINETWQSNRNSKKCLFHDNSFHDNIFFFFSICFLISEYKENWIWKMENNAVQIAAAFWNAKAFNWNKKIFLCCCCCWCASHWSSGNNSYVSVLFWSQHFQIRIKIYIKRERELVLRANTHT